MSNLGTISGRVNDSGIYLVQLRQKDPPILEFVSLGSSCLILCGFLREINDTPSGNTNHSFSFHSSLSASVDTAVQSRPTE